MTTWRGENWAFRDRDNDFVKLKEEYVRKDEYTDMRELHATALGRIKFICTWILLIVL